MLLDTAEKEERNVHRNKSYEGEKNEYKEKLYRSEEREKYNCHKRYRGDSKTENLTDKRSYREYAYHKPGDKKGKSFLKPSFDESFSSRRKNYSEKRAFWDNRCDRVTESKSWKKKNLSLSTSTETVVDTATVQEHAAASVTNKETVHDVSLNNEILTEAEKNKLAAKIVKAELCGNDKLAEKLKSKLERNKIISKLEDISCDSVHPQESEVVLTHTSATGFTRPVFPSEKGKSLVIKGKIKILPEDHKYSLKNMFEREKATTSAEHNALYESVIMKSLGKLNDDFDTDDLFIKKMSEKDEELREKDWNKAIKQHKKRQQSLDACKFCIDSKMVKKHMIASLGTKAYVCVPSHVSLTEGHCLIVPISHVTCLLQSDEDLWNEIILYRKCIVKMFQSEGKDCIFFESALHLHRFPHFVLHCIPVPLEVGQDAPIYFKKAIMECDEMWAQNKKLVDLSIKGDLRKSVPKGLPYFFVDFGLSPGYAHVVENEALFPTYFAQEIIAGMLDLLPNCWRKPKEEEFSAQSKKVMSFLKNFSEFDPMEN